MLVASKEYTSQIWSLARLTATLYLIHLCILSLKLPWLKPMGFLGTI